MRITVCIFRFQSFSVNCCFPSSWNTPLVTLGHRAALCLSEYAETSPWLRSGEAWVELLWLIAATANVFRKGVKRKLLKMRQNKWNTCIQVYNICIIKIWWGQWGMGRMFQVKQLFFTLGYQHKSFISIHISCFHSCHCLLSPRFVPNFPLSSHCLLTLSWQIKTPEEGKFAPSSKANGLLWGSYFVTIFLFCGNACFPKC